MTLTESFYASISTPSSKATNAFPKDASIFLHELQPTPAQRHIFKKSATDRNCLVVTRSHLFAAQAAKAVVHVYSREKGSQEATIAFGERISAVATACEGSLVCLGMESGSLVLWEVTTGRRISIPQPHLQPVTALAISLDSNYLLTTSADASIHVWSLPSLLSFTTSPTSYAPLHTLSHHRSRITSLAIGHSTTNANIAVSAGDDGYACVWDYVSNTLLRTYILSSPAQALLLDPLDLGFYVGFESGQVQRVNFHEHGASEDELRGKSDASAIVQPDVSSLWPTPDQNLGAVLCMGLSWDTTRLLTGHASGKIALWDCGRKSFDSTVTTLPGPVTNLHLLPPTGLLAEKEQPLKIHTVVKPRVEVGSTDRGVPGDYSLTAQFTTTITSVPGGKTAFEEALTHPSFPPSLLEEGLAELAAWRETSAHKSSTSQAAQDDAEAEDFMALDADNGEEEAEDEKAVLERQNGELREQVAALRRVQKVTFRQLRELREERDRRGQGGQGMYDSE